MIAVLAASLLFCGSGPSARIASGQFELRGQYSDIPLSHDFNFDTAKREDYAYLSNLDLFRGGLDGVRLSSRQLTAPGRIRISPGLTLVPDDIAYQRFAILYGYSFDSGCGDLGASEDEDVTPDLLASVEHGPFAQIRQAASQQRRPILRVVCLEMNKKMPENMRFKVQACPDPILAKLCAIDAHAIVRGLYDQPRIWIYTDNATMADCNAHLVRPVTPSIYLHALWDDSTVGAVDLSKPGFRKCVDPKLIEGINAPTAAKVWLVQALDQVDPQGLTSALETDGAAFQGMVPDDSRAANMAALLDALADSKTPSVVAALPKFIDAALPADRRAAVLSKCRHKLS